MTLNRNVVSQISNHVIILQTMMLVICFSAPLPFGGCALGFLFLPLTFHNNWPSCHRKCIDVLIISSTGNTQTSRLLFCFLYLFVELMVTCFLYLFVEFMVTCFLYLFVEFMVTRFLYLFVEFMVTCFLYLFVEFMVTCLLYLFVEFMVTCFLYLFVEFMVTCFLYLFVEFMVTIYENIWFKPTGIHSGFPSGLLRRDTADAEIIDSHICWLSENSLFWAWWSRLARA